MQRKKEIQVVSSNDAGAPESASITATPLKWGPWRERSLGGGSVIFGRCNSASQISKIYHVRKHSVG